MSSPGINGEGELRGQPANPGSPGKMAVKTECVCVLLQLCCSSKVCYYIMLNKFFLLVYVFIYVFRSYAKTEATGRC